MKKIFLLVTISILLLAVSFPMQAQYVRPGDQMAPPPASNPNQLPSNGFADKLSIGGGFALQFGTYTFVELEPLISYHFNSSFMIGLGPIYQYESVNDPIYGYYSSSTYGGRFAAMYFLPDELSKIFLMGEYDVLNVPEPSLYSSQILRGYIAIPMLGIGYKEQVSDKLFFCIYGLWNFNNSLFNPYSNPTINAGFDIGLWH
jgi:hypothetical protein